MESPAIPTDELARLAELRSLNLLDTQSEERFDHVTRLAQRLFNVPIALITLVDRDRQWFKSNQGLSVNETARDVSFCGHALHSSDVMTVTDATADDRFADNPLVLGDPGIRFYAGCPITGPGGHVLGTLCIIDREARAMTTEDTECLRDLAGIVEKEIAARHLATVDELTGLSNRRGFETLAAKTLQNSVRRQTPATLMFLDLDHLKTINDEFGHAAGDRALQEFAAMLTIEYRESDIIARLGGDEFVVLLNDTHEGLAAIERINVALGQCSATTTRTYHLGASVGFALFNPDGSNSLEALVQRADVSMYAAKHQRQQRQ